MSLKTQFGQHAAWAAYGYCDPAQDDAAHQDDPRVGGFWFSYKLKSRKRKPRDEEAERSDAKSSANALAQLIGKLRNARLTRDSVLQLTAQIFPASEIRLDDVTDPDSGAEFVQVIVSTNGNVKDLLALNDRWHRELAGMGEAGSAYCLSLVPSDESN